MVTVSCPDADLQPARAPLPPAARRRAPASHPRKRLDALRLLDIVLALLGILALLPFMLLVALAVRLTSPGPALFRQRRIGRNGVEFVCFKFRTMCVDADERLRQLLTSDPAARAEWQRTQKLKDDVRITPVGRFLRASSFDELPQLFNVLAGTMSLVGPRPIVASEIAHYGHHFSDYCSVRPGLTGLWQISGRNDTSYRRRVALDVYYSRRRNLWLNGAIMLRTLPAVLLQRGAY